MEPNYPRANLFVDPRKSAGQIYASSVGSATDPMSAVPPTSVVFLGPNLPAVAPPRRKWLKQRSHLGRQTIVVTPKQLD